MPQYNRTIEKKRHYVLTHDKVDLRPPFAVFLAHTCTTVPRSSDTFRWDARRVYPTVMLIGNIAKRVYFPFKSLKSPGSPQRESGLSNRTCRTSNCFRCLSNPFRCLDFLLIVQHSAQAEFFLAVCFSSPLS